jgi:amylosucrase
MYNYGLHQQVNEAVQEAGIDIGGKDNLFYTRFMANTANIFGLYMQLYEHHPEAERCFGQLVKLVIKANTQRSAQHKERDAEKIKKEHWFLSNQLTGMSLYVDRFCGNLQTMQNKLDYFEQLGVNFLHLMPLFESPPDASDGGYAVADFRKVAARFGSLNELQTLQTAMQERDMYLMLDIVLNHTSDQHEWAMKARKGEK